MAQADKDPILAEVARWLDLRAAHRVGGGKAECLALADLLRTGEWRGELEELSKCRSS